MNLTTVTLLNQEPELILGAYIIKVSGGYNLVIKLRDLPDSAIATSRNPFSARVFKKIQAASNIAVSLGIHNIEVIL